MEKQILFKEKTPERIITLQDIILPIANTIRYELRLEVIQKSIKDIGCTAPLTFIEKGLPAGKVLLVDGFRRLEAIANLIQEGKLDKNYSIPYEIYKDDLVTYNR